jgi:DNA polymerase-3 subunit epsilon
VTTLLARALDYLRGGSQPPLEVCREVLGLSRAAPAVAERLVVALLGADPRFTYDVEGRWSVVPAPAWAGVPLAQVRFAVVDVETTGMRSRGADRITEIAVAHVDGGRVELAFESLVNPERPIPWRIRQLTGITDELVAPAPRFAHIVDQVSAALAGRVFVAHNARFDWAFVRAELERERDYAPPAPRLCTVRLARALVPELPRRNLDSVLWFFGVEATRRHRAAGDALATARVLQRLLDRARERGISTWPELQALAGAGMRS